jgi:hypothetical protein
VAGRYIEIGKNSFTNINVLDMFCFVERKEEVRAMLLRIGCFLSKTGSAGFVAATLAGIFKINGSADSLSINGAGDRLVIRHKNDN